MQVELRAAFCRQPGLSKPLIWFFLKRLACEFSFGFLAFIIENLKFGFVVLFVIFIVLETLHCEY